MWITCMCITKWHYIKKKKELTKNCFLSQFQLKLLGVDYGAWKQARGVIMNSIHITIYIAVLSKLYIWTINIQKTFRMKCLFIIWNKITALQKVKIYDILLVYKFFLQAQTKQSTTDKNDFIYNDRSSKILMATLKQNAAAIFSVCWILTPLLSFRLRVIS